jgi:hypothetical protein
MFAATPVNGRRRTSAHLQARGNHVMKPGIYYILDKLSGHSRLGAIAYAFQYGLIKYN